MMKLLLVLTSLILLSLTLEAREMKCDGAFPDSPADTYVRGAIYCLKKCDKGYIYLVQDRNTRIGKGNDTARFRIVRSSFYGTNSWAGQRILNGKAEASCETAPKYSEAVPLVTSLRNEALADRGRERAKDKLKKLDPKLVQESEAILAQVQAMVANVQCTETSDGKSEVRVNSATDSFFGSDRVKQKNEKTVAVFTYDKDVLTCQSKDNPILLNQLANNLVKYDDAIAKAGKSGSSGVGIAAPAAK
jgi:hypothetical protein